MAIKTILSLMLVFSLISGTTSTNGPTAVAVVDSRVEVPNFYAIYEARLKKEEDSIRLDNFLAMLAWKESKCDWTNTENPYKYLGKYQFGLAARRAVGVPDFTWAQFKANPYIWPEADQDTAVVKLMVLNHKYLNRFFRQPGDNLYEDWIGKEVTAKYSKWYSKGVPVKITWHGLYAACHLAGQKNVRKFLNSNGWDPFKDGNGVRVFDYLKYFEDPKSSPIV